MFPRNNFVFNGHGNNLGRQPWNGNPFPLNTNIPIPLMGFRHPMFPGQGFQNAGFMPEQQRSTRSNSNQKKRYFNDKNRQNNNYPPLKRARISENIHSASEEGKKYKVPINHGTEKITISIWNYFLNAQMGDDDFERKLKLRKSLHTILSGTFSNCRLFIVGSSMTGFATKTSDVDMCLMISQKDIDQKFEATYILSEIAKALRICSFVNRPQVIRAKVPILKFNDGVIECDLNINNTIGIRNTHLLRHYAYIDWRLRPLMLFIKKWARYHDINDASKKTISSYSFSLMCVHFLQAGVKPAVLPCLQKTNPNMFSAHSDVRHLSLTMEELVQYKSQNTATLGELFLGFLNYYANEFNFDRIISIRLGCSLNMMEASQNGIKPFDWKCLRIEEPFERSNTARSVYDQHVFWRVLRVFKASFNVLHKTRDLDSILSRPF